MKEKQYSIVLKLLHIRLGIEECLGRRQEYLHILSRIADLHLQIGNYNDTIKVCNKGLDKLNLYSPM